MKKTTRAADKLRPIVRKFNGVMVTINGSPYGDFHPTIKSLLNADHVCLCKKCQRDFGRDIAFVTICIPNIKNHGRDSVR